MTLLVKGTAGINGAAFGEHAAHGIERRKFGIVQIFYDRMKVPYYCTVQLSQQAVVVAASL